MKKPKTPHTNRRDEFAKAALCGLTSRVTIGFRDAKELAREAYLIADAMEAARRR